MGESRSNPDDVKQQHAQHLRDASVPKVVYSGQRLEIGKFLHPALDVRYGGVRKSYLPPGMNEVIRLLSISIGLDVTGSNAWVARAAHQDFPQFWELIKFLLPENAFHLNVQMGAIDDYPSNENVVQMSQWEGDGLTLENVLRVLYPVGAGYGNGKEAYALYLWLLLHFNDLEVWQKNQKGIAYILFDAYVAAKSMLWAFHNMPRPMQRYFERCTAESNFGRGWKIVELFSQWDDVMYGELGWNKEFVPLNFAAVDWGWWNA